MKLLLDHHFSNVVAVELRRRSRDVVTAAERNWNRYADDDLLAAAGAEARVVVTNNVADFVAIDRQWTADGRAHAGLIFTSDRRYPRRRDAVGPLVAALDALLAVAPDLRGRWHWL